MPALVAHHTGKPAPARRKLSLSKRRDSRDWHKNQIFRQFFLPIFEKADQDGDGLLSAQEFLSVIRSGTLDLHVSLDQARELWDVATSKSPNNAVSFLQFLPIIRQLVLLAYTNPDGIGHNIGDSDQHWIQIGWSSDDPGALPIYLNKVGRGARGRPALASRQSCDRPK